MIGLTARQVLAQIPARAPQVDRMTTTIYTPTPGIDDRGTGIASSERVREALRHGGYLQPIEEVPVAELANLLPAGPGRVRGICSRVRLASGDTRHLPMLDFRCAVTDDHTRAILGAVRILGETSGVLLNSGRSYHYYGFAPRDLEAWHRFETHAILLAPLVDVRYIAHSLLEDLACLRLDSHPSHPFEPVVIAVLSVA
jgi:hypothetical protein